MWRRRPKSPHHLHPPPPPSSSFSFSSFKDIQNLCSDDPPFPNSKLSNIFHRVRLANSILRSFSLPQPQSLSDSEFDSQLTGDDVKTTPPLSQSEIREPPPPPSVTIPEAEKKIVVYFTSLRVVRSTFEDCRFVLSILRAFRVSMDERDLAMDSGYLKELQKIFGGGQRKLTLPCVFIGGRYVGGADEIRDLHDAGELKKIVEGLPAAAAAAGVCEVCGGHRFVLCPECDGSHKMYIEKSGFRSCGVCNENGLIRCPSCC